MAGLWDEKKGSKRTVPVLQAVMSLSDLLTRHALVSNERFAALGIRKLPIENFIVFYVISDKDMAVKVVRILYGRRDWEQLL